MSEQRRSKSKSQMAKFAALGQCGWPLSKAVRCLMVRSKLSNFIIDNTGAVPFRSARRGWRTWNAWKFVRLLPSLSHSGPIKKCMMADHRFALNRKRAGR
jgi:hypothetical protein